MTASILELGTIKVDPEVSIATTTQASHAQFQTPLTRKTFTFMDYLRNMLAARFLSVKKIVSKLFHPQNSLFQNSVDEMEGSVAYHGV
jgi:hypothetical protein